MGKVWPRDSVALNTSTTALSNVVSLDESPLLEGLIYAGTDDGLLQVTEDGGKNWRKIEDFPGVPKCTYCQRRLRRRRATPTLVFVTFNNWQRGDYKPYIAEEHRSRQELDEHHRQPARPARRVDGHPGPRQRQPAVCRHRVRPVRQRRRRRALGEDARRHAGDPGARHDGAEARERSGARRRSGAASTSSTTTARCARSRRRRSPKKRSSSRCATPTRTPRWAWRRPAPRASARCRATPRSHNPPTGAVFTYNVGAGAAGRREAGADDYRRAGRQVRRMDVDKAPGLRRVAWNLRGDPPPQAATPQGGRGACRRGTGRFWRPRRQPRRPGGGRTLHRDARKKGRRNRHANRDAAGVPSQIFSNP